MSKETDPKELEFMEKQFRLKMDLLAAFTFDEEDMIDEPTAKSIFKSGWFGRTAYEGLDDK